MTLSKNIVKTAHQGGGGFLPWTMVYRQSIFEKTSKGKTPNIAFTGMPFYQLGFKRLVCHQGKDLNVNAKKKYAEEAGKVGTITSF